jgi:hypothetical protein
MALSIDLFPVRQEIKNLLLTEFSRENICIKDVDSILSKIQFIIEQRESSYLRIIKKLERKLESLQKEK